MQALSPSDANERSRVPATPAGSKRRCIIFANGLLPNMDAARALLQPGDRIVCADAGARHARRLGLLPDLVVGDLDSIQADDRQWLTDNDIRIAQYPHDKDQTDLELAIQHALVEHPSSIIVAGALGARLDHTLGNIALLTDDRLADFPCALDDGVEQVVVCRSRKVIQGAPGDLISLVPWGVPTTGVQTAGLKWPLHREILRPESSRGISNEMTAESSEISIESGLLVIIHRRLQPQSFSPS